MTSAAPTLPPLDYSRLLIPAAAFEILAYLTVVSVASLAFIAGWLTVNGAVVLTVLLLISLIVLSWINLGQGRHPCFLFLCTLLLFQGGRLVAYCLGAEPEPLRIVLLTPSPIYVPQAEQGITLLCVALSAMFVYAPCRWLSSTPSRPNTGSVAKYLPYLYFVFYCSLPLQIVKNYLYLKYIQANGGYLVFFTDYAGLTASVPLLVRAGALITTPVFVAIFVFETRRRRVWLVTLMYFASAALFLLAGSRMDAFSLILTLWYVSRIKHHGRSPIARWLVLAFILVALSNVIQLVRFDQNDRLASSALDLRDFVLHQGISINVTEVAVTYRSRFEPYIIPYLLHETLAKFQSSDVTGYHKGDRLGLDISLFLNRALFQWGFGAGGSYLAQGYILGGLPGVIAISFLIGLGIQALATLSRTALSLFFVATVLPDVFLLPRGGVMVWLSTTIRTALVVAVLGAGWMLYRLILPVKRHPSTAA